MLHQLIEEIEIDRSRVTSTSTSTTQYHVDSDPHIDEVVNSFSLSSSAAHHTDSERTLSTHSGDTSASLITGNVPPPLTRGVATAADQGDSSADDEEDSQSSLSKCDCV